jgi:mxaJ protein
MCFLSDGMLHGGVRNLEPMLRELRVAPTSFSEELHPISSMEAARSFGRGLPQDDMVVCVVMRTPCGARPSAGARGETQPSAQIQLLRNISPEYRMAEGEERARPIVNGHICSRVMHALAVVAALSLLCACGGRNDAHDPAPAAGRVLRVCADPNNLPFSNRRLEGFENRIAELVADEMNASLDYTWWAQRRGFIRNTLRACSCDVVIGVPSSYELVLATAPYYRSSYVFVYRRDSGFDVSSFDDPILKQLKIGVQIIGDDYANTPAAHALTNRGIIRNVAGYSIYGDYSKESPPAAIVDAVASGEIDLAVVWGPLAGYFGSRGNDTLVVVPVTPQIDLPFLPFVFDISMGVRRQDSTLRDELDGILRRRRDTIESILDEYRVPRIPEATATPRTNVGGGADAKSS